MKLTPQNCPDVSQRRLDAVNALSEDELRLEIDKGRSSRFGEPMQPVLKLALSLRTQVTSAQQREEDLEIARERNSIAKEALRKADQARFWSAIAVLVTVILAAVSFLNYQ
jgi:hypothetical protein